MTGAAIAIVVALFAPPLILFAAVLPDLRRMLDDAGDHPYPDDPEEGES